MLFPSALMWIVFGAVSAYFAKIRGKNPYLWFFLGMLFGVFGLLYLFFTPKPKRGEQTESPTDGKTIDISPAYDPKFNEIFWYYLDPENKQYGPMSFEALYRLYRDANISKKTFVWNESLESWKPLDEFILTE